MSQSSGSQENKVVSLFAAREKREAGEKTIPSSASAAESFDEVMRKNKEVADRMKKEREKKNKSVLKSYRIKN